MVLKPKLYIIEGMKKVLKLQDHKHTAKRLEHRHTSYRGLFLILALFGFSLLFIQNNVTAEDYLVTAKIAAPMPSGAAQITSPIAGFTSYNPLIEIIGTCPNIVPAVLVQINNNGQIAGSTSCKSNGTFNIYLTLTNGDNYIVPKILTITNDYGLDGQTILIKYSSSTNTTDVTSTQTSSPGTTNSVIATNRDQNSTPYFVVKEPFIVYNPSKEFSWTLDIAGGTNPYTITIDWGDGKIETFTKQDSGKITISHKFSTAKTFTVKVAVTDVYGIKTVQTFAAITLVSQKQESVMGAINNSSKINYMFSSKNLIAIYIFLILLVSSFWYGAKIEHHKLVPAGNIRSSKKRK